MLLTIVTAWKKLSSEHVETLYTLSGWQGWQLVILWRLTHDAGGGMLFQDCICGDDGGLVRVRKHTLVAASEVRLIGDAQLKLEW